jgi:hypothetical protein
MKNLDQLANEIWEQKCPQRKRELMHQMVDYSSAKKKTKILAHMSIDGMPDWKLDRFVTNYKLSGDGHKVIK